MFSTSRKQAQQIAQRFLAGHCGLIAWWTLRHAGVLDAIAKLQAESAEGLDPLVYATRTNMAPDVLQALLEYLATAGLVVTKKERVFLTPDGQALLEHEDGPLLLLRAYQPILDMTEHLLAKLKTYAPPGPVGAAGSTNGGGNVFRKSEYLLDSQAKRYPTELFPAVADLVHSHKLAHLLDLTCGTGDLLIHTAARHKRVVGVGIGNDAITVRRANAAITAADLESRLIAVAASPVDVCTHTQRTFDRIGISRQLWKEINCLIATNFLSELPPSSPGKDASAATLLAALPANFPTARFMFIEPVASPRFDRTYFAPEHALLLRLARAMPPPIEKWRDSFAAANLTIQSETPLTTDGLVIFLCARTP